MTPDELIDVVRAGRAELEAGISDSYWVIGNIITWEDLAILVWEAKDLGMEIVLRRSNFLGGLPTFRFQWMEESKL